MIMIRKYLLLLPLLLALSCSDSIPAVDTVVVDINVTLPETLADHSIGDATVTFYNVTTGKSTLLPAVSDKVSATLPPGLYDISYSATATLAGGAPAAVRASLRSAAVTANAAFTLDAYANVASDDLILKEIFFTGTLQPSGDQYNGDQYFKIVNNTDHVIYADGLVIFESLFLTTQKYDYTPDIIDSAVSVEAIYAIPGGGADYPVLPGGELLIADIAINHREINPNSVDLSGADFEWYDISSNPKYTDIDNPAVPNLDKWYCYTLSIWQLHNRGYCAYGLARIPVSQEEYLADYYYTCDYENVTAAGAFPMTKRGYRMPNEWIVDMVNLSVESEYQWNVCAPQLDSGYTFCGTIKDDKTRYFKSVRRKFLTGDNGRTVLADTNNSSDDFNGNATPSETELQHASVDIDGTPATTVTIDGITPANP